jgi:hypothetical protein
MWILPNLSELSRFAQGLEVSTSELITDSSDTLSSSLFVNEKAMRPQSFSRRCKTDASLAHLVGLTLEPSRSQSFVKYLTSRYSEASRVSRSRSRDSEKQMMTPVTSSPQSKKESRCANRDSCYLKMLTESQVPSSEVQTRQVFSNMSWKAWKAWATSQRRLRSAREKWEEGTTEEDGSSWACWPTPTTAEDYGFAGTWQGFLARQAKFKAKGTNLQKKLDVAVQDPKNVATTHGISPPDLTNNSSDGSHQEFWPTPRANKMEGSTNEGYGDCLMEKVIGKKGASPHKLSPLWVSQLMGLPADWATLPPSWERSTQAKN